MHGKDTSVLNIGQDINELEMTISENTHLAEHYFEVNYLSINPTKTHYIMLQIKP
jgi:hypothetical protein